METATNNHAATTPLKLEYFTSAEAHYEKITLDNQQLTYTFFHDEDGRCRQWFQSRPCWQMEDLQTITGPVDSDPLNALYQQLQSVDLMQLDEILGETDMRRRAYEQRLFIQYGSKQKQLTYRSSPHAVEKPEVFRQIESFLRSQAKQLTRKYRQKT